MPQEGHTVPNTLPTNSAAGGATDTSLKLPRLAPDLSWPSDKVVGGLNIFERVSGINAQGSLTTALSASGKFSVDYISFAGLTAESITIKLTIDGSVIWNDTYTCGTTENLMGITSTEGSGYVVRTSFLLEIQTATDTNIDLNYRMRPIL